MGRGCQLPIRPVRLKDIPGQPQRAVEGESHSAGKGSHFIRQVAEPLGGLPAAPSRGAPQIRGLALRPRWGRKLPPVTPQCLCGVGWVFSTASWKEHTDPLRWLRGICLDEKDLGKIRRDRRDRLQAGHVECP